MGRDNRVHYMDNLRAFAMLLGIFFHAALAYSPMLSQIWLTADPQNSVVVDYLAYFSHTFRMPLFFVIAGYFAALLTEKRGLPAMAKNRLVRIAVPFILFLPLIFAAFAILFGWALEAVQHKSPMLNIISFMMQNPDAPKPPITTTHLWFLYQLIFFYISACVCSKFLKLDWFNRITRSPIVFLSLAPMCLVPALMTQFAPTPAPEQFMPQLWVFGFHGLFFAFGWGMFRHEGFLDRLKPYVLPLLLVSIGAYSYFYYLLPDVVSVEEAMTSALTSPEIDANNFLISALQAYIGVFMTLFCLVFGKNFLNSYSKTSRLIADSSYWIYIIHLPVLWFIQFILLDRQWSLWVEFLISSLGTIAIGFVTYLILVRWTPLGWLLNGRKTKS